MNHVTESWRESNKAPNGSAVRGVRPKMPNGHSLFGSHLTPHQGDPAEDASAPITVASVERQIFNDVLRLVAPSLPAMRAGLRTAIEAAQDAEQTAKDDLEEALFEREEAIYELIELLELTSADPAPTARTGSYHQLPQRQERPSREAAHRSFSFPMWTVRSDKEK